MTAQVLYAQLGTEWTRLGSLIENKFSTWPLDGPFTLKITNRGLYPFLAVDAEEIEVEPEDESEDPTIEYPVPTTNAGKIIKPGETYFFNCYGDLWLKALNLPTDINISSISGTWNEP